MKHLKVLTIVGLIVSGVTAFVGSAGATTVTSPTGTAYTGNLKAVSGGHGVLHNPIAKIECAISLEGPIESHGPGVPAVGKATNVVVGPCTNSWHVTTVVTGQLIANWTSGYNGTLESTETTAETTRFGIVCRYATQNTKIGTVTGGNPASLHLEMMVPFHSGSALCGSGATQLTGGGTSTPSAVYLDN